MRCLLTILVSVLSGLLLLNHAEAARIKDIASLRGVRANQLVGYGVVVGLRGTGDGNLEYTNQSVRRMLDQLGVKLEGDSASTGNVAAVIVTATLPPFARAGNPLDVTVHSLGDASSLEGGTLIQTPLRAANQNIYAVAQGPLLAAQAGPVTAGRVPGGAIIERDLEAELGARSMFRLTLHNPDFTTAARAAKVINMDLGGQYAKAIDPGTVDVVVPFHFQGKPVELIAAIEGLDVETDQKARVVVNPASGTVVIGEDVRVKRVALSHGDMTIQVGGGRATEVRGPAQAAEGPGQENKVALIEPAARVGELVNVLNGLGVGPKDLIQILENLKSAGALEGELEVL